MSGNHLTARQFVGREIRRAREVKDMSRAALAKMFPVSESLIAKWENGRLVPLPEYVGRLQEILGLPDMIVRVIDELVTTEVSPEWFGRWPEFEKRASALWSFQNAVIPGLLQTPEYARSVLGIANLSTDLEETVRTRLARQEILTKEDPPMFVALISECVLHLNVGGSKVMHDQLIHLAEMAERDNIIVHIIPNSAPSCAGFISGFVIASFDGSEVAYVDNQLDGSTIENPDSIARLRRLFDIFRSDALSRTESIDLIRRAAQQWIT